MDLHQLAIQKLIETTWEFPNVTYNFMWEYFGVAYLWYTFRFADQYWSPPQPGGDF